MSAGQYQGEICFPAAWNAWGYIHAKTRVSAGSPLPISDADSIRESLSSPMLKYGSDY